MKSSARIAGLYALIAVIATLANLATQALVVALYLGPKAIAASVLAGTVIGLPIKYVLEKKHIFDFKTQNVAHDGKTFVIYSAMGVFTTLLFWGIEYLFHIGFGTDSMRYLGGAIGLSIGYYVKYHLDKKFVFVNPQKLNGRQG